MTVPSMARQAKIDGVLLAAPIEGARGHAALAGDDGEEADHHAFVRDRVCGKPARSQSRGRKAARQQARLLGCSPAITPKLNMNGDKFYSPKL